MRVHFFLKSEIYEKAKSAAESRGQNLHRVAAWIDRF